MTTDQILSAMAAEFEVRISLASQVDPRYLDIPRTLFVVSVRSYIDGSEIASGVGTLPEATANVWRQLDGERSEIDAEPTPVDIDGECYEGYRLLEVHP